MGFRHQNSRSSSSGCFSLRFSTISTIIILFTSVYLFLSPTKRGSEPFSWTKIETGFNGDLRDANFPWNSLCFGNNFDKLKLAVFSKTWPVGAAPGGMERHAATLYHALAAKGHEIHVFTVPSDRKHHLDIHEDNLHVYFAANDHGSVNCSLAFEIFNSINANGPFDYVHTESVSFVHDPESGARFRRKHGIPQNVSVVMEVAGRLVRDKGHPLLYEAFSKISKTHTGVYLLVAGSGPWGKRYAELGSNVKVLGALEPSKLSEFYNANDVFVNPTLRPQGLDLTLMEAMHCGKPVLTPNYPSIVGTVVVNQSFGYTFSPNVESFVDALKSAIKDGPKVLQNKGIACRKHALSMFTASKMADAYERFFLCLKNPRFCQYPLPTDC
ncbi:hypothetical protein like AT1G73160 [Hibiscus trionum]|uniref:Glycosyl transferase family 1 domain-containing protein n=1 Tax=Hibiscus trionum TaxID=183268 RepID=A0A9W7LFZ8_HIBTR|nr:hypothetical protein like AT1G73160 [Hibiscus trionum]